MDIVKIQQRDHVDEVMTTLKYFAKAGIATDLALMAGSEPLHLHQLVLSCFSNYFESLSEENVKYIINADVRKTVLEALIDYIYKGIANISQRYKKQLLLTASSLQIEGLGAINSHDFESSSKNDQATIICPNHKLHLSQKIWDARQNPSKTDVVFIVNNKHKVFAHACILSACSPFLLQVFTGHCAEKRKPYIVALRNIRKDDLEFVLQFCYKGEVHIPSQDIESVYKVADLLGIDTLSKLLSAKMPIYEVVKVPEKEIEGCSTNIISSSLKPAALAELLRYERMVDVYIFCKQKIFKAHSVILSIYSIFFKELAIFLNYNLKDVVVLMESFNSNNIQTLLEYIYVGEAKFEGDMEEFKANMSEWLDLNILPVSPDVAPRIFTSLKSSNKEGETKIDSAVCNDTVLKPKTESRRFVKDGKSKDDECKESSEKEEFISNKTVHVKEELNITESDAINKKHFPISKHQNKQTLYTIKCNSHDCDENVPEDVREKMENRYHRINSNDKLNASRIKCIPGRYMHAKVEIKNELVDLECAHNSFEKENNMIGETHVPMKCEDDLNKKENMKNKTYAQLVNKQIVSGNNVHENTISLRSEKEDSEIDDPEKLESVIKSSSDELNDIKKNNPHVMAKKHKQRTFECQTCNSKFTARWEFKLHLLDHPDGNVRQCKLCLKEFSRPSELQNHLRTHTGARPMQCETCGMCFISKNTLRKHEHTHTKKKTSEFECEVCKKTFSRKQYLQEHKRTHSGSKPYECDVCHKSFVGKTGLNHHKKIHKSADEKKSAMCDICGKSFTRHALWTHIKLHNKEQKPSFASVSSNMPEGQNYVSEPDPTEMLNNAPLSGTLTDGGNDSMCLNISEKTADDINLLQLKPVEEAYLNQPTLQNEEVEFPSMQTMDTSSMNNLTVGKAPDMTTLSRRPYSITIDGNLCYNTTLSTDGDITPSITLLPERTDLEISDMDVLLPVTHPTKFNVSELNRVTGTQ
ncbi:Protein glass, partial [Gryllus bimaculatus]